MSSVIAWLAGFRVIPAGTFLMGTPERELSGLAKRYGGTRESYREESPQHQVALAAFAIAASPVTNSMYAAYVAAGAAPPLNWRGTQPPADRLDHPVTDVSWQEAVAWCDWLSEQQPAITFADGSRSSGPFRLPSEAEWERAARGEDGRTFPWGEDFQPALANTRESGFAATTPINAFPAGISPWGALDMAGNVWEWTASLDGAYPYRGDAGREERGANGRRILRGGCYANPHGFARTACRFRLGPHVRNEFTGFRPAISLGRSTQ